MLFLGSDTLQREFGVPLQSPKSFRDLFWVGSVDQNVIRHETVTLLLEGMDLKR